MDYMGPTLKKKVLLTGANGFLGKCLASELIKYGIDLIKTTRQESLDSSACNLASEYEVATLINKFSPDLVVHCAAFVPKTIKEYEGERLSFRNKIMLKNILNATKVPIIYISSMTVYGLSKKIIRHELDAGVPESSYGTSKYESELLLKEDGRDALSIRIPGLFGQDRGDGIVVNTIRSLCNNEQPNFPKSPILWATMDVEDAAKIIAKLSIKINFNGYMPINVGYSGVYSINKFLSICEGIFKKTIEYKVVHPEFEFDLTLLRGFNAVSTNNLKTALIKLKEKYELNSTK
jgi:nucleoside-diphosphate-sugar epimerase